MTWRIILIYISNLIFGGNQNALTQIYIYQNLEKMLKEKFPGKNFEDTIIQPTRMLENEVVLIIPEKTQEWEIIPNRTPTAVRCQ